MRKHLLFFVLLILLIQGKIVAQNITGTVVDAQQVPIPGVTVSVKGAAIGTATDMDGKFSLNVSNASTQTLVFTYLGYATQEQAIRNNTNFNIVLQEDTKQLEEVVVVGYGTQQRRLVTGAIASVNARDIAKIPNDGRPEVALQGRTPGVIVGTNSGQPGDKMTVRVRGITTFKNDGNDPLWVVDGIIVSKDNLNFLNQSDIQSMEVLKDAASAAIYGTRAANGVILVTTKKGSEGKFTVNYNGFAGTSGPARLVNLTNATEYATLMNERAINDGAANLPYANPSSLGAGTDWQKQIFSNNAFRTNHDISLSGGTKNANIFTSFGYQNQEGIVLPQVSYYEKYSFRINHNETFGKIFKFGQDLAYSRNQNHGIGVNTEFGNAMANALNLDPLTPLLATEEQAQASQYQSPYIVRDPKTGLPFGISGGATPVGQEIVNPIAQVQTMLGNHSYSDNFIGNSYFEIDPIKELAIRTQIGLNRNYWGEWTFNPLYLLNSNTQNITNNSLYRTSGQALIWNWENTISFTKSIQAHTFGILLGHSIAQDGIGNFTGITVKNLPVDSYKDANFNWPSVPADVTAYTYDYTLHRIVSFFGRVNYNYAEKYLLTAILRKDGSTRFGANNRWGTFPSISVGWVPSLESFWTVSPDVISFLKIRGGYGVTGNDNFDNFQYAAVIGGGNNYVIGPDGNIALGNSPNTLDNPDLKWEKTTQTSIGFDANFLRNFNMSFDWFIKKTTGVLQQVPVPQYSGVPDNPWANVGDITNSGIEILLGYNKQVGDWRFGATGNFATLKNKVTYIGIGIPYVLQDHANFQTMGALNRNQVGYPVNTFWGYKTNGIFQTAEDVQNYKSADGTIIQPNAKPGDFRWTDLNGDGVIDSNDATSLGSPLPAYTYGLTLTADWGNKRSGTIDFMAFFTGQGGNKIFQGYRRLDVANANFTNAYLSRWTGEGTSNSFPRLVTVDANGNFNKMSDFYLQKGDFLRLKNIQLGYSLPSNVTRSLTAERVRIYVAAENLLTLTKYNGYDPEIGGGVFGIDKGFYPQARTYMVGLNLTF